ncbi:uncharacterized protein SPSK_08146 [Sporothrix schenckii 1099-18]|uniref:Uncharacterized protein n=1 Tax=Sporothrix schenckii 1099-18 TaxID=1397361 RepID=A0A0F2MLC6_SPOSC|nr:uncharacterized protein SPSK_08146 [Sporothrix schenckii 1099-18]KJR88976.1 hypothetical protein SPSK_08146 [Sporothrix schenckii 1099-18]
MTYWIRYAISIQQLRALMGKLRYSNVWALPHPIGQTGTAAAKESATARRDETERAIDTARFTNVGTLGASPAKKEKQTNIAVEFALSKTVSAVRARTMMVLDAFDLAAKTRSAL